jgi:putative DNA primase/helicase
VQSTIEFAIEYTQMGWAIFPCHSVIAGKCTCGNAACTSQGKHPRNSNGVNGATNDKAAVRALWTQWPDSNIGLACGRQSGIVAIDIDAGKGGYDAIDDYETNRPDGPLPRTLRAISGGGGNHLVYRYPSDEIPVPNRVNWLRGVDVRSDGGYIVVAPSTHRSGTRYAWSNWGEPITELPVSVAFDIRRGNQAASDVFKDAIKDASSILDGVEEGKRDDTLFRWACRLRRQHSTDADGGRAIVTTLVLQAAEASGFSRIEALRKVDQAFKQNHVDDVADWLPTIDNGDGIKEVVPNPTDLGNAARFVALHGNSVRYVQDVGWFIWVDHGWQRSSVEYLGRLLADVPPLIRTEAAQMLDVKEKNKFRQWAMTSESNSRINAIEELARKSPLLLKRIDDFDSNMDVIACLNGLVDLRTGLIRQMTREDLVTRNTNVIYDPTATIKQWDDFLLTTMQGDRELIEYMQMAAGYTLTGRNSAECFMLITGKPASGKSTWIDGLKTAMGSYARAVQPEVFMYRRGKDTPQSEMAALTGVRMASVSEIREGDHFNETLIKAITGGDTIDARYLYHEPFNFTPQFKIWFATNHDPLNNDDGMMRRLKRIEFAHVIPKMQRDPRIKLLLKDTVKGSPAVLNWMVQGAIKFYANGYKLIEPASVTASVASYRNAQDTHKIFMLERTERDPNESVNLSAMFAQYNEWCRARNEQPGRMPTFRQRLESLNYRIAPNPLTREAEVQGVKIKQMLGVPASWVS